MKTRRYAARCKKKQWINRKVSSTLSGLITAVIIAFLVSTNLYIKSEVLAKNYNKPQIAACYDISCHSSSQNTEQDVIPDPSTNIPILSAPLNIQSVPPEYELLMEKYSKEYGVNKEVLKKIANCESGFNPGAHNGIYGGMYQFSASTWASTRSEMGLPPDDSGRFSAEEAIKTTAFKIAHGGIDAWPICGK